MDQVSTGRLDVAALAGQGTVVLDGGLATELMARGHDLSDRLSWVRDRDKDRLSTDPRLPVAVYRAALQHGVLNRVRYRQMDEALPLPDMPPA